MNKKGFTLAEVLISLAIIGVVAAITIPALYNSSQNQTLASKLSATVSSLENGLSAMIIEEGANGLCGTEFASAMTDQSPNYSKAAGVLGEYLKNGGITTPPAAYSVRNLSGTGDNTTFEDQPTLTMKNGSWVIFTELSSTGAPAHSEATRVENGGNLFERFAVAIIDVNGSESPNMWGRDVFSYSLGTDGILYPTGGKDERIFTTGSFEDTIDTNCSTSGTGEYCAAKLMLNGYKVD